MKKHVLFALGVSALLAGAPLVSAQAPAQTPPSTDPSAAPAAQSSPMPQTVTGCLTPSADGKSFTLTEINPTGSAASTSAAAPKTWTVQSSGDVDLTKYANHKVEITASSDNKSDMSSSSSSSSASTAAATSGPRLHVKAVKDISNTCS
jgi:hypothetical protein